MRGRRARARCQPSGPVPRRAGAGIRAPDGAGGPGRAGREAGAGPAAPRRGGFTLIEVLIAFTILAVALAGVLPTIAAGLGHERVAGAMTGRVLSARSLIARTGRDIPFEAGESRGRLTGGADWVMTMTPLDLAPPAAGADGARAPGAGAAPRAWLVELRVEGRDGRAFTLATVRPEG